MAIVELEDSRRLTGPNLLSDSAGAVIDGRVEETVRDAFVEAWRTHAARVLRAVSWGDEELATRTYPLGVTVFHSAPVDALYAATEVNEWAWAAAAAEVGHGPSAEPLDDVTARLESLIDRERNPALLRLRAAAAERGLTFLSDDDHASVGTGTGSRVWAVADLPDPVQVPWPELHDIPRVLVTGTNGKTTTVRMVAEIAAAAGRQVGFTCTDGIYVDGVLADGGDWSGPGGARALLRDPRVEVAVLETARGGMLRRGLALDRAHAALVTNVAEDHLGEWGVATVADVATAKLVVARAVQHGAPLVVNAEDPVLAPAARALGRSITWISADGAHPAASSGRQGLPSWVAPDEVAWVVRDGWLVRKEPGATAPLLEVTMVPAALGGLAAYNVANALGAAALARALGMDDHAIRQGLVTFDPTPERSPGRTNLFEVGDLWVLVDYVHNPHGFHAVGQLVRALAPRRVGLMVGHAGDRDDEAIRDLARAAWALGPERVAVKELGQYLRGRAKGEVPELIRSELARIGASEASLSVHDDEVSAARALLEWCRSGDLVLLSSQAQRDAVLRLVEALHDGGWRPGLPLPDAP
jgi:UDP-N-acetylmuramyl tripeptide synthase